MNGLSIAVVFITALIPFCYEVSAQTHFNFTSSTGSNATVIVPVEINPNIGGAPLSIGDEIGVFTPGGLCVGAVVWNGSSSAIAVWGASSFPSLPGIQVGESISYRFWRRSTNTEFTGITVSYFSAPPATQWDGLYQQDALYVLSTLSVVADSPLRYAVTSSTCSPLAGSDVMITAQLVDINDLPLATMGKTVTWTSTNGGTFGSLTSTTNLSGVATVMFTTSSTAGTVHTVTATDNTGINGASPTVTTTALAPTVATLNGTNVGATSAQLNGTVNPNGASTTCYFEYGLTTTYGAMTSSMSAGSSPTPAKVSATPTGLISGSVYHFRVVAANSMGSSKGNDVTFMTTVAGPTAVTNTATKLTSTSATLKATVNPNGASTTYYFEYGATTNYGLLTSTMGAGSGLRSTSVSAAVSGLTPGISYHFRVVAMSIGGTSRGADQMFITKVVGTKTRNGFSTSGIVSSEEIDQGESDLGMFLEQNYPNPFNPTTTIKYSLPYDTHVMLEIVNMLGQRIGLLVDAEQDAGYHEAHFDGANLTSGMYFYRLKMGEIIETRRMILQK